MRLPCRGGCFFVWVMPAKHFDDWQGASRLASCGKLIPAAKLAGPKRDYRLCARSPSG